MKRTDYAAIAGRYDENAVRHRIPPDPVLAERLAATSARPLDVLDVACGTGNYLAVQAEAFGDAIRLRGLDASAEMLERARVKVPGVELRVGRAEALPYGDASFDYVTTRFAYHHFEDRVRALAELGRVLRPDGVLTIVNVDPSLMPRWWTFRFFPEARLEDETRYWTSELLLHRLEEQGFDATLRVTINLGRAPLAPRLADAERRDGSELAILSQEAYERGLGRMRDELARDPGASVVDEVALVEARATPRPRL